MIVYPYVYVWKKESLVIGGWVLGHPPPAYYDPSLDIAKPKGYNETCHKTRKYSIWETHGLSD